MPTTPGNNANAATLKTSAILSPGVFHSVGTQCHTSLTPRKNASANQHIKKGPLTRAEAEIFDARVAAGSHVAFFIMALFDGMLLRFARRLEGREASDDRPQGERSRSFV
jgi:hypothetical protein